jgi:hypothetical protein
MSRVARLNRVRARVTMFNASFNNISAILWRFVLLVEETGVPGENTLHIKPHRVYLILSQSQNSQILAMIETD